MMASVLVNPKIRPMVVDDGIMGKRVRGLTVEVISKASGGVLEYDQEAKEYDPRHYDHMFEDGKPSFQMRVQNSEYRSFYNAMRKSSIRKGKKIKTKLLDATLYDSTYLVTFS